MNFSKTSIVASFLMLSACAQPPLPSGYMMIEQGFVETLPANPSVDHHITLGEVTVAENAVGDLVVVGAVTPQALREALLNALMTAGFHQRDASHANYVLTAHLSRLEQDNIGLEMSAIASIDYRLTEQKTGREVYSETISVPYTMTVGEIFDGQIRAKLVTLKSISENLTHLMRQLSNLSIHPKK